MRLTDTSHVNGTSRLLCINFDKMVYFLQWMLALNFIFLTFSSKNRGIIVVEGSGIMHKYIHTYTFCICVYI